MIKEQVIEGFVEELSSKKPVPGGGGASAMAGALGTALGLMVGNLTVGKKRYAAVEAEVYERMTELTELQKEMFLLADEDAMVFAPLAAAYSLPSGTEKEKAHKGRKSKGSQSGATADHGGGRKVHQPSGIPGGQWQCDGGQ